MTSGVHVRTHTVLKRSEWNVSSITHNCFFFFSPKYPFFPILIRLTSDYKNLTAKIVYGVRLECRRLTRVLSSATDLFLTCYCKFFTIYIYKYVYTYTYLPLYSFFSLCSFMYSDFCLFHSPFFAFLAQPILKYIAYTPWNRWR